MGKKNMPLYIGIAVIILVILVGGGVYLMNSKKAASPTTPVDQTQNVKTMKPEVIGLIF
jgi:cell division protein FtsN